MPTISQPITECPACGSGVWDNRGRLKTPKSPHFRCKSKECGQGFWLQTKGATRASAPAPANGGKWTWVSLMATYRKSLLIAEQCLKQSQERNPKAVPFTHAEVLSAAATVFIAASRDGVREVPKPAPAPAPEDLPDELPEDDDEPY